MSRGHGQQRRPGVGGYQVFNSYNQPAINKEGVVVFRARSRGGEGGGHGAGRTGTRHLRARPGRAGAAVHGVPAHRHGAAAEQHHDKEHRSARVVQRVPVGAAHRRRFRHDCDARPIHAGVDVLPADGTETRTGTSGVYTSSSHGMPTTGASMLGDVHEGGFQTFPYFQVPVQAPCPQVQASTSSRGRLRSRSATRSCSRATSRWVALARQACSTATSPPRAEPHRSS